MDKYFLWIFIGLFTLNTNSQQYSENEDLNPEQRYFETLDEDTKSKLKEEISAIASKNTDSIKIVSVSPNKDLMHGDIYTLNVVVVYNLASKDNGVLKIGFNSGMDHRSYRMVNDASKIVPKGNDLHVFTVKTRVIDWEEEGEAFYAMSNLSEHPHPQRWKPLCSDRHILHFK